MYVFSNASVNAAVLNSIDNFNIRARITGTVNGISFTDANIVAGSFSITNQCSSETELSIGQVYVGELNITLTGLNIDRYSLYGTRIIPTWGIYVNSAWRNVPLGTFVISEVEVVSLGLKIRAYDNMSLLDVPFTSSVMGGTPHGIAQGICRDLGLTLGTSLSTFATFPNYNVTLSATQTTDYEGNKSIPQFSTYRDVIACLAQVTCTNVTIDRSGQVIFVPYPSTAVASIDTSHRKMGGMTADFETYYDGIIVTDPATKAQTKYTRTNPSGLTMDLGDNPFINTAAIRNAILNALTFRFHPFRMDILNAPLYDLMDCINLPDGIGDGTKLYCITKYTWTYHGSYTLVGAGQDPKLVAVSSAVQRSAAQAAFIAAQKVTTDEMDAAIDSATAQITGNNGGYVVLHDSDNDGQPDEILIMNTPSIEDSTQIWRFNKSGLGYATSYAGTYGFALTSNGAIVANRITSGELNVDIAKAGTLKSVNYVPNTQGFSLNLETGEVDLQVTGTVQSIETYYAESIENTPPQWDYPKAYLFDADGKALYDANGNRLVAKRIWNTTVPTTPTNNYRWMRNLVTYKDGATQLTSPVPLQDYYGRANLVMQMSKDGSGNPIGVMSALADYIKFSTGQLEIDSPQFKLDREGNAFFAGAVTATSLTLGSLQSGGQFRMLSPDGFTDINLSGDSNGSYISVTDTTSYARITLRGQAGSLILSQSSDSGATYSEVGSVWVNGGTGTSNANFDIYRVGRFNAAPAGDLRNNQVIASWDYTNNLSTIIANKLQIRSADGTSSYTLGNAYYGSNGEVVHYTSTGGNILRAYQYQVGTEADHKTAIQYSSSNIRINANSIYGSNGEVIHYTSANSNNVLRAYEYQIGNEASHKSFATYNTAANHITLYADGVNSTGSIRSETMIYSPEFYVRRTSTGGSIDKFAYYDSGVVLTASKLYLNDTTAVGTTLTANATVSSVAASTETDICSLTLTKGKWFVIGQFRMQGSGAFQASVGISTVSGSQQVGAGYSQLAVTSNLGNVSLPVTRVIDVTSSSQTIYLVAWHNYSSARTTNVNNNTLTAVCIA